MKFQNLYFFKFLPLLILFSSIGFSCQRKAESADKRLKQAALLHEETMQIDQKIQADLANLGQERSSIQIQGRALSMEEIQRVDAIYAIESSYDWFEKNLVELPGQNHGHGAHKGHDHKASMELSPKDMLLVQQEFLDSIKSIQARISLLLQK